jgi:hypothetical protein
MRTPAVSAYSPDDPQQPMSPPASSLYGADRQQHLSRSRIEANGFRTRRQRRLERVDAVENDFATRDVLR